MATRPLATSTSSRRASSSSRRISSDAAVPTISEGFLPERKFCTYMHRICPQPRIANRKYCLRHILESRDSPFRQCQFVHPQTSRRCRYPAAKTDRREYLCKIHANKVNKKIQKRPMTLNETPYKIFEACEIYCHKPEHNTSMATAARSTLKFYDPDSDHEQPLIENVYIYDGDSDAESVDEEITDLKKHAGVYTAEEVAKITKEKMIRLQQLYLEQFQRLSYLYREKRRDFLYRRHFDRGCIGKEFKSPRDERLYRRYLAYKNYRKLHGTEAILKHHMKEKRKAQADGIRYPLPMTSCETCQADSCHEKLLPYTKYCPDHILLDSNQQLFRACGVDGCRESVLRVTTKDTCPLHCKILFNKHELLENALPEGIEASPCDEIKEYFEGGMDDMAALGLDAVNPSNLFGLTQSVTGEPEVDESTDSAVSEDGLPTDTALYDDEPVAGPSRPSIRVFTPSNPTSFKDAIHLPQMSTLQTKPHGSHAKENFESLRGNSVRIVGGQLIDMPCSTPNLTFGTGLPEQEFTPNSLPGHG